MLSDTECIEMWFTASVGTASLAGFELALHNPQVLAQWERLTGSLHVGSCSLQKPSKPVESVQARGGGGGGGEEHMLQLFAQYFFLVASAQLMEGSSQYAWNPLVFSQGLLGVQMSHDLAQCSEAQGLKDSGIGLWTEAQMLEQVLVPLTSAHGGDGGGGDRAVLPHPLQVFGQLSERKEFEMLHWFPLYCLMDTQEVEIPVCLEVSLSLSGVHLSHALPVEPKSHVQVPVDLSHEPRPEHLWGQKQTSQL
jgi:hypothetical protein